MAFCTNCGKSLDEGARFCTNCGTAVQASGPAPVVSPNSAVAAAPATAPATEPLSPSRVISQEPDQMVATPAPKTSAPMVLSEIASQTQPSTSPVFVIVSVVLLVLIAGGIGGTVYLQRRGKAKATAQQPEASQAGEMPSSNSLSVSSAPASSPATSSASPTSTVPVPKTEATPSTALPAAPVADSVRAMNLGNYPAATPVAIATFTGETVVAGFLTRDTPQQVMQFYKIRFPSSTTNESERKAELFATLPGGERIRIQAQPQGSSTQVMILQER